MHRRKMVVVGHDAGATFCQTIVETQSCGACRACSIGAQDSADASNSALISLPSAVSAGKLQQTTVGDTVEVMAPVRMLLALSLVVYLLPVVLMLLFTVCCSLLYPASEVFVAFSALAGLVIGLALIHLSGQSISRRIAANLQVHRSL